MPPVVATPEQLDATIAALAAGTGPVAVDAERAHGFRYSQRAYLIQLRRAGSGTHLVDPIAFAPPADGAGAEAPPADLRPLGAAIADAEWVIHAASQDLPCLYQVGLVPRTLFDTELAARLLGFPRVALGTMLEELLGVRLLKEHSASDWSTRPLPAEWLTYAALDVELLLELRDVLHAQLDGDRQAGVGPAGVRRAGRRAPGCRRSGGRTRGGVRRESTRCAPGAGWRTSPRSGRPGTRSPASWTARPAGSWPTSGSASWPPPAARAGPRCGRSPPSPGGRPGASRPTGWRRWSRCRRCGSRSCRRCTWPATVRRRPGCGRPRTRSPPPGWPRCGWRCRTSPSEHELPVENLLTPDYVRRLAWRPPTPVTEETVDAALAEYGARPLAAGAHRRGDDAAASQSA